MPRAPIELCGSGTSLALCDGGTRLVPCVGVCRPNLVLFTPGEGQSTDDSVVVPGPTPQVMRQTFVGESMSQLYAGTIGGEPANLIRETNNSILYDVAFGVFYFRPPFGSNQFTEFADRVQSWAISNFPPTTVAGTGEQAVEVGASFYPGVDPLGFGVRFFSITQYRFFQRDWDIQTGERVIEINNPSNAELADADGRALGLGGLSGGGGDVPNDIYVVVDARRRFSVSVPFDNSSYTVTTDPATAAGYAWSGTNSDPLNPGSFSNTLQSVTAANSPEPFGGYDMPGDICTVGAITAPQSNETSPNPNDAAITGFNQSDPVQNCRGCGG